MAGQREARTSLDVPAIHIFDFSQDVGWVSEA